MGHGCPQTCYLSMLTVNFTTKIKAIQVKTLQGLRALKRAFLSLKYSPPPPKAFSNNFVFTYLVDFDPNNLPP